MKTMEYLSSKIMQKMSRRLIPDLFLFFKALYEVKVSGLQLSSNIFRKSATWYTVKTNCMKLLD